MSLDPTTNLYINNPHISSYLQSPNTRPLTASYASSSRLITWLTITGLKDSEVRISKSWDKVKWGKKGQGETFWRWLNFIQFKWFLKNSESMSSLFFWYLAYRFKEIMTVGRFLFVWGILYWWKKNTVNLYLISLHNYGNFSWSMKAKSLAPLALGHSWNNGAIPIGNNSSLSMMPKLMLSFGWNAEIFEDNIKWLFNRLKYMLFGCIFPNSANKADPVSWS